MSGDAIGTVEAVSLRTTRLRDFDGVVWHVPNGEIKRLGNKSQQWSRAVVDVPVALRDRHPDRDRSHQAGRRRAVARPRLPELVLGEPEVWGIEELTGERLVIRVAAKTRPLEQCEGGA